MPRSSLPKLSSIKDGSFEPSRKNPISLRNDEPLDLHLKQLKVGEAATPLELSETELRINGDLFLDGKLKSHKIATDNEYLEIESNTYIRFLSDSSTGHLDLFVTSGTPYYLSSGTNQFFLTESQGTFNFGNLVNGSSLIVLNTLNQKIQIKDADDNGDLLTIEAGDAGASKISTTDDDGTAGHLTLEPDGDLILDPVSGVTKFYLAGDTDDLCTLTVAANGATTIATTDSDGVAGNLTLDIDGNIELNAEGGTIDFKDSTITLAQIVKGGAGNEFYLQSAVGTANYLKLYTVANGASTISTVDDDGTVGHLTIAPNGILKTEADDGGISVKEIADAGTDTAGYGQVWVHDTTPNELCFTDDAGTDIIGIGKYHYETKISNFNSSATGNYIPLAGYIVERTSTAHNNEYISMIAPFNGTLEKLCWRSEIAHDGTAQVLIYESSDGTEVPGTLRLRADITIDIADDIYQEFDFSSPSVGTFPYEVTKGRIYAIKLTTPSAPYDTNVTTVWKWDITS